ncbi:MAG: hypothetical protein ABIK53_02205 [bacterium]
MSSRREKTEIKLNLLQNAYDYLNASLEYVVKAKKTKDPVYWKYALLNITLCIELLMKERIRREHSLLIYANIDNYKKITRETKTISWTVAVERLKFIIENELEQLDFGRLDLAKKIRNQMLHYDVHLQFPNAYHDFANLINFISKFFKNEIRSSESETLHLHIKPELWKEEEEIDSIFSAEITCHNGIFMDKTQKEEIIKAQKIETFTIDGAKYKRIRYGSREEGSDLSSGDYANTPCHNCSVIRGRLHAFYCDMEKCPKCMGQLLNCKCYVQEFQK